MRDVFFVLLLVLAAFVLGTIWMHARYARLGKKRRASSFTYESFRSEVGGRVSNEVCRTVYDYFYHHTGHRIPVLASDDLGDVYGIVDDDLVDDLRELAVKCDVAAPTDEEVLPVKTVLEAALLMESLRQGDRREQLE